MLVDVLFNYYPPMWVESVLLPRGKFLSSLVVGRILSLLLNGFI